VVPEINGYIDGLRQVARNSVIEKPRGVRARRTGPWMAKDHGKRQGRGRPSPHRPRPRSQSPTIKRRRICKKEAAKAKGVRQAARFLLFYPRWRHSINLVGARASSAGDISPVEFYPPAPRRAGNSCPQIGPIGNQARAQPPTCSRARYVKMQRKAKAEGYFPGDNAAAYSWRAGLSRLIDRRQIPTRQDRNTFAQERQRVYLPSLRYCPGNAGAGPNLRTQTGPRFSPDAGQEANGATAIVDAKVWLSPGDGTLTPPKGRNSLTHIPGDRGLADHRQDVRGASPIPRGRSSGRRRITDCSNRSHISARPSLTMLGPEANELVLFDQAKLFFLDAGLGGRILGPAVFPRAGLIAARFRRAIRLQSGRAPGRSAFKSGPNEILSRRTVDNRDRGRGSSNGRRNRGRLICSIRPMKQLTLDLARGLRSRRRYRAPRLDEITRARSSTWWPPRSP